MSDRMPRASGYFRTGYGQEIALTKTRLVLSNDHTELISVAAHLAFPIRDGVPMLSLDEARDVDPDEMRVQFPPTI